MNLKKIIQVVNYFRNYVLICTGFESTILTLTLLPTYKYDIMVNMLAMSAGDHVFDH